MIIDSDLAFAVPLLMLMVIAVVVMSIWDIIDRRSNHKKQGSLPFDENERA